jgi:protein-S-isoprenylcysteine O-methyltransferase Ste14
MWGFVCCLPVTLLNSVPIVPALGASTVGSLFAVNKLAAASPLSLRLGGPLSLLGWLPVAGGLAGLLIETLADNQKSAYRSDPKNGSHWCDTGVWKMCRYPNYFGELLVWWSIYGLCAPALTPPLAAISIISPLFVTFLLFKVCVHIYIYTFVCTYLNMYIYVDVCTYAYKCIWMYMHIYL